MVYYYYCYYYYLEQNNTRQGKNNNKPSCNLTVIAYPIYQLTLLSTEQLVFDWSGSARLVCDAVMIDIECQTIEVFSKKSYSNVILQ